MLKENYSTEGTLNTSELIVKCLENEGVEYIFGIPGEENMGFLDALKDSKIKFITTRHEQGAAFMADVYGRLTGNPGVCLATLGPGATNLITGVADANLDGAPLIAITGQVGTDKMHIESHQYLDLISMFAPVTKWNKQIVLPEIAPEIIRKAFRTATSEKPGAVHIDLPENIATMKTNGKPLAKGVNEKSYASDNDISKAAELLSSAKRPVILSGNGSIRAKASKAVIHMAEKLNIPVLNTFMGKGIIPYTHHLSFWSIGLTQRDYVTRIIEKSDLIVCIGYDLVEYSPSKWNNGEKKDIIHVAAEKAEIHKSYIPSVEVVGDITDSVFEISRRSTAHDMQLYSYDIKKKLNEEYEAHAEDYEFPVKPQKILYDLRKALDKSDIVISDVGAHKMWVARRYKSLKPNTCIISNGFASMGIAVPGAIAAKLVNKDKKVVAITGDGGFMMNSQEFETALRIKTPFVTLIFNDNGYGLIKWKQEERYGESNYIDFTNPDFVKYAESMGAKGYKIEKTEDLLPTLKEALELEVPAIIDCPVDYSENMKLTKELKGYIK